VLKVLALFLNFFATFCLSICRVSGDGADQGIAALVVFVLGGIAYIIASVFWVIWCIWPIRCTRRKTSAACKYLWENKTEVCKCVVLVTQALAGLFYYVGDNLSRFLLLYGEVLNCDDECINGANATGFVFLALGAGLYFPMTVNKISMKTFGRDIWESKNKKKRENNNKDDSTWWVVLMLLSMLTDYDLLYTAITRVKSTNCPSPGYTFASWVFWAVYSFVLGITATYWIIYLHIEQNRQGQVDSEQNKQGQVDSEQNRQGQVDSEQNRQGQVDSEQNKQGQVDSEQNKQGQVDSEQNKQGQVDSVIARTSGILIVVILALFLLADNELPLSCTIGKLTETTTTVEGNDELKIKIIRLACWTTIIELTIFIMAVNFIYYKYVHKKSQGNLV